jgi:23S rRNA pseudouridine955/2504/2580 synthase
VREERPGPIVAAPAPQDKPARPPSDPVPAGAHTVTVEPDEAGMRVDRFLTARFPDLSFAHIQRIVRTGQLRIDGKRAKPNDRLEAGQQIRIPPLKLDDKPPSTRIPAEDSKDVLFFRKNTLFEDDDVLIINKPSGLAVQGGSGTTRHVDGMLEALRDRQGQKPRLVHRLDKDTAGCLVIAKTRFAATALAKSFRSRVTRKVYWAVVAGVPRTRQGRISTYLAREDDDEGDSRMAVSKHGAEGATHALTYYAVIDQAGQKLTWLSMKPVTGRTHQLRAHAAHIGHPIVGDPKYFDIENWEFPGGIQNRLHLLARRIVVPHPRTGHPIDVTAPLPAHMQQTFNLLGLDATRYDPIEEAPEA